MFTVCPKCALTLVVTAADLRVAQGYVRCGRCSSVFNALARLSDERLAAAAAAAGELQAPASPGPESHPDPQEQAHEADADLSPLEAALTTGPGAAEESIPEEALEFDPEKADVGAVFVEPPPNPQWTAATGSFKAMQAARESAPEAREASAPPAPPESSAPPEAPAVPGQSPGESGEPQVDIEIDAAFLADMLREPLQPAPQSPPQAPAAPAMQPAPETQRPTAPRTVEPARPAARAAPRIVPAAAGANAPATARDPPAHTRPPVPASVRPRAAAALRPPRAQQDPVPAEPPLEAPSPPAAAEEDSGYGLGKAVMAKRWQPHVGSGGWSAGAAVAVLVLLAQIVNHYRDDLAADPRFNRPVSAVYGALGVPLAPHWDLRAYDVRQLGAIADPAGTGLITVRASVKNSGRLAQPLPLLRVTLEDRFGNRIAARDVAPRFYVPHTMPDSSYLAGGQRIDAEMGFVDPGSNAVGFEIDACLPASGGGISCANDLAAR